MCWGGEKHIGFLCVTLCTHSQHALLCQRQALHIRIGGLSFFRFSFPPSFVPAAPSSHQASFSPTSNKLLMSPTPNASTLECTCARQVCVLFQFGWAGGWGSSETVPTQNLKETEKSLQADVIYQCNEDCSTLTLH